MPRARSSVPPWTLFLLLSVATTVVVIGVVAGEFFKPFNVTYDHRALIIDGQRRMLISAGVHYPRATPEMWPDLIAKSKEGGADVIQTYVFWGAHEPVRGQYNFEGRYDLVKFVKVVGSSGLYLHLRIGPYVCAEWNFGGFPVWLRDVPGIEFRTNNKPFKEEMQRFVTKIVNLMREELLFSWQGGPIILLQIENEYGNIEKSYGQGGKDYVKWAASMAVSLGAGVPWVMCKQTDAPDYIIDACNGYYCDGFRPNSNKKPILWTEDWDGWYASWGGRLPHRPAEDLAFAVARFFQRGGSFQNYYMYFGGTNFGRSLGGPFYITSYDYDAPLDEYGLLSQPKWGHLKDLHAAIKLCEVALVSADSPQYIKLGRMQEAHIYRGKVPNRGLDSNKSRDASVCSAFLANIGKRSAASVTFRGQTYTLPPWSVSILPDCKNVAFNTAKVGAHTSIKHPATNPSHFPSMSQQQNLLSHYKVPYISQKWMTVQEPIGIWSEKNFTAHAILEHLNVTKDYSDYLWYFTRVYISNEDISSRNGVRVNPILSIDNMRDAVYIFVNGQLAGSVYGHWVKVKQSIQLSPGYNDLMLLSLTIGLQNYGAFFEKDGAGFKGQVKLKGLSRKPIDLSILPWTYQVGLKGEFEKMYTIEGSKQADWVDLTPNEVPSTFSWYKTYFDAPDGLDPVVIDLKSMGKGQIWVNGHLLGRYWTLVAPKYGCTKTCDYRGPYNSNKCRTNCGKPTQTLYHVPRSWLQATNNLLVLFEETGGNPYEISVETFSMQTICGHVSETDYPPLSRWSRPEFTGVKTLINDTTPALLLYCEKGHILSIEFASYGTPGGNCQQYSEGKCHSSNSLDVVSRICQGRESCSVAVSNTEFGADPCPGIVKTLAVQAKCLPSFLLLASA